MDLIFSDGEKVYLKEMRDNPKLSIEKHLDFKLMSYQKQLVDYILNIKENNAEYRIYGDDFKIEFIGNNICDEVAIKITDYDENQNKECDILIDLDDKELDQLIHILKTIKKNRKEVIHKWLK